MELDQANQDRVQGFAFEAIEDLLEEAEDKKFPRDYRRDAA